MCIYIYIQIHTCTHIVCVSVYICMCIYIFIHSVFCLTTGPKPPPKRFLHIVRTRASSFK